ncbi:hypothetical protein G7Y79_00016g040600 [Physcia stellaris]|nr:hypothetical protein G7Y79_00016g040600 [Physcia stellaris]
MRFSILALPALLIIGTSAAPKVQSGDEFVIDAVIHEHGFETERVDKAQYLHNEQKRVSAKVVNDLIQVLTLYNNGLDGGVHSK